VLSAWVVSCSCVCVLRVLLQLAQFWVQCGMLDKGGASWLRTTRDTCVVFSQQPMTAVCCGSTGGHPRILISLLPTYVDLQRRQNISDVYI